MIRHLVICLNRRINITGYFATCLLTFCAKDYPRFEFCVLFFYLCRCKNKRLSCKRFSIFFHQVHPSNLLKIAFPSVLNISSIFVVSHKCFLSLTVSSRFLSNFLKTQTSLFLQTFNFKSFCHFLFH